MKLTKALLMTAPSSPKGAMNRTLKLSQTQTSSFLRKSIVPQHTQQDIKGELNKDYAFKMVDEMRFTEEEVIRMNITLGITGDMFRERGVFFTDFMAATNTVAELKAAEKMKRKRTLRLKSMMIAHL